jgi:hypothetical protein
MSSIEKEVDELTLQLNSQAKFSSNILSLESVLLMKKVVEEAFHAKELSQKEKGKLYNLLLKPGVDQLMDRCSINIGEASSKATSVFQSGQALKNEMLKKFSPEGAPLVSTAGFRFDKTLYQSNESLPDNYFQLETDKIVKKVSLQIERAIQSGSESACFKELIESLGKERQKIANMQLGKESSEFGVIRKEGSYTNLNSALYKEYQNKFLVEVLPLLQSSYNQPALIAEVVDQEIQEHKTTLKVMGRGIPPPSGFFPLDWMKEGDDLKKYENVVYIEASIRKGAESLFLTRYYVGIDNDALQGSSGSYNDPVVVIYHTNPVEVSKCIKGSLSSLFSLCIHSKGVSLDVLKERVGVFRYLLAQAAPYQRGSAAIGEWLERGIYQYLGYDFLYRSPVEGGRPIVDLDALTSLSLSAFLEEYKAKADVLDSSKYMI